MPEFQRLKQVLDNLPDEAVLEALQEQRGRGRNDSPVQAMWRAVIAGIVFQHDSVEHLVRELHRKLELLQFCGFHLLPRQSAPVHELGRNLKTGKSELHTIRKPCLDAIPHQWNFTRFLKRLIPLEEKYGMISHMIWQLREQLMDEIADFGCILDMMARS